MHFACGQHGWIDRLRRGEGGEGVGERGRRGKGRRQTRVLPTNGTTTNHYTPLSFSKSQFRKGGMLKISPRQKSPNVALLDSHVFHVCRSFFVFWRNSFLALFPLYAVSANKSAWSALVVNVSKGDTVPAGHRPCVIRSRIPGGQWLLLIPISLPSFGYVGVRFSWKRNQRTVD